MTQKERELLIDALTSAHRGSDLDGNLVALPAWHDLAEADRVEAAERTVFLRRLEAALDPNGLSSTARAVLARIRA